ncbi:transposase (plasmid) [Cupriavidus taiwanensis]|uniref:Transposase n=3 Tax=Cupriavidus TaxID=106589 RepID=A0A375I149_9BURK|nr:transposase [Cupriavidus taiwanensis]SPD61873.1 transposase [Cupriavidus taiwanensis]SPD62535.1 transposase [Cupriavidus neocaledonicus]SPD62590.1 transposase [Cupriavidus neocaledonicus]SPD69654.1 transposase [Cupriavidus taiwanensis]
MQGSKLMPANRMTMRKIKEVLRLKWACGLSHWQIARATGVSVGAVSQYAAMAKAAGLDWAQADSLNEDTLESAAVRRTEAGQQPGRTGDAGLPLPAPRAAPQGRDTAVAVGGIPGRESRGPHLPIHAVLLPLPGLGSDTQAVHAPAAPRRREAVCGLRRSDGADSGPGRRPCV